MRKPTRNLAVAVTLLVAIAACQIPPQNNQNRAPTADAGADQTVITGEEVQLDGGRSDDPDAGDTLSYIWALTSTPAGSSADLTDPDAAQASFTADEVGQYLATLTVSDGSLGDSDSVTVTAVPPGSLSGLIAGGLVQGETGIVAADASERAESCSLVYSTEVTFVLVACFFMSPQAPAPSLAPATIPELPQPGLGPFATATPLPGTRALFTGGADPTSATVVPVDVAYLLEDDAWTTLPPLSQPRTNHTATRLQDGRVLITGGTSSNLEILDTAESYDPATQTFTLADAMNAKRSDHTATLLPDGRVLIAGGCTDGQPDGLQSSEFFDPATDTFTPGPTTQFKHCIHNAVLLDDGRVLIPRGGQESNPEVYDPALNAFVALADVGFDRGVGGTATLLPDGRVLLAGGIDVAAGFTATAAAEVFDPSTDAFSPVASMNVARWNHLALLLPDGRVLLTGGTGEGGGWLSSAEVFDPSTDTFTLLDEGMPLRRTGHVGVIFSD